MQITLSATGTPAQVLAALHTQLTAQTASQPASQPTAEAAIYLVTQELNGVSASASVSVTGSLALTVTKPAVSAGS